MNKKHGAIIMPLFVGLIFWGAPERGAAFRLSGQADESQSRDSLMEGKRRTDLSIQLDVVVDGTPERIFELWTTPSSISEFFGKDAVVDGELGGRYEVYFLPRTDPRSDANSTKGARILDWKTGEKLAFEWKAPPFAGELNTTPLPTWVEVTFRPLSNNPEKTHVSLAHLGFGRGGNWEKVYEFFVRNWAAILFRLDLLCAV